MTEYNYVGFQISTQVILDITVYMPYNDNVLNQSSVAFHIDSYYRVARCVDDLHCGNSIWLYPQKRKYVRANADILFYWAFLMANFGIHHIDTKFLCMLFHV